MFINTHYHHLRFPEVLTPVIESLISEELVFIELGGTTLALRAATLARLIDKGGRRREGKEGMNTVTTGWTCRNLT